MYYVTKNYQIEKFETIEQAFDYILKDIESHGLKFWKIYDNKDNGMRVIIFQYETLFLEIYVISQKIKFI